MRGPRRVYMGRARSISRLRRLPPPEKAAAFKSNDELLEAARQMFHSRQRLIDAEGNINMDEKALVPIAEKEAAWTEYWHASFELTGSGVSLEAKCEEHDLDPAECELLILLLLDQLSLAGRPLGTCADVVSELGISGSRVLETLRMLSEHGRLFRAGLIYYEDPDEDLRDRRVMVDPGLVETVLYEQGKTKPGWPVESEEELYKKLGRFTRTLEGKSDALRRMEVVEGGMGDFLKLSRRADRLLGGLQKTLDANREWKLRNLLDYEGQLCPAEQLIVIALLGKALGHLPADNDLFTGNGLARAIADDPSEATAALRFLRSDQDLLKGELIQPCGGGDVLFSDDPDALGATEFELTDKSLELAGIEKRHLKQRSGAIAAREPKVRMEQLVLSDRVRHALDSGGKE
ncbi:MAG TPA: hypothetical protein ENN09_01690 [Planctomycetes bacterium]|nr:hypothetical protein [Planctomycetota bacterium]